MAYFITYASFGILNPTFQQYELFPILLLLALIYIFFSQKKGFDKLFLELIVVVFVLLFMQAILFGNFTIRSFVGRYMVWLTPYFILRIVGFKYFKLYCIYIFESFIIDNYCFYGMVCINKKKREF